MSSTRRPQQPSPGGRAPRPLPHCLPGPPNTELWGPSGVLAAGVGAPARLQSKAHSQGASHPPEKSASSSPGTTGAFWTG